jgi:hypothetical protein
MIGLASPDRKRALAISMWESEEAMHGSTRDAALFRNLVPRAVSISGIDRLEVVFEEAPES